MNLPNSTYIEAIKERGYVLVKRAFDPVPLLADIKAIEYVPPSGDTPYLNQGHDVIYNLQNKNFLFTETVLRHEIVKDILAYFLNDEWYREVSPNYILRSMIARSGGERALPLHIDSFIPSSGKYCWSMQVSFILEDQTEENGCTVVAPGSYQSDSYATPAWVGLPIESEAGDILIWDSRLHHGTTGNKTGKSRWAFISTFTRWWIKQNYLITKTFPYKNLLSKEEQAIIGYCSEPPLNEHQRIDIKGGYELL